jgi:DNA-binding response OmpR family regulator
LTPPRPAILVVEADRSLGEAIAQQLAADGYRVELARNCRHARVLAGESRPHVALIGSLEGPAAAGALVREIRAGEGPSCRWDRQLPALVIGAGASELEMLRAFDSGADDFIPRPVVYLELRARLRALLRRAQECPAVADRLEVGALRIDLHTRATTLAGQRLELRRMEYELLVHLAREPHRVFHREDLLRSLWGYRSASSTRTVDSHASRLRRKLTAVAPGPWLVCVWGVGYRLT